VNEPKTLLEAVRHFSDPDVCHAYMRALKWPAGSACPKCGHTELTEVKTRRLIRCKGCRKQFSAKVGTIFESSPLGLDKWFVAVWAIANCKNGISSLELSRALGIQQRSAWFMLHRIRTAMRTTTFRKLSGEVESDETFVGGKAANMHKSRREREIQGRGAVGKAVVHGLLERGDASAGRPSQVNAAVVPNTDADTLMPRIAQNVEHDSQVYTDAHASYSNVAEHWFHSWVDHLTGYVRDRVHTNGLENFWSCLKRAIKGSYIHVSPWHLERYVDEAVFRFNERKRNDAARFKLLMEWLVGRRITYRRLCMIDGTGWFGGILP
jgi:transposase-like protein